MSPDPVGGREADNSQGPRAERKPCHHDSTRVDGTLGDCCLRCGTNGYWHEGHRHDRGHPSGKVLFVLDCERSSGSAAQNQEETDETESRDAREAIEAAYMRGYRAHAAGLSADPREAVRGLSRCPSPERRCGAMPHLRGGCSLPLGHEGDHHFPASGSAAQNQEAICPECWKSIPRRYDELCADCAARSPQDEDQEAGIEAVCTTCGGSGSAAQNQEERLWHALFRAKGAIPSSYGELHRELAEVLSARSPQDEDHEEKP